MRILLLLLIAAPGVAWGDEFVRQAPTPKLRAAPAVFQSENFIVRSAGASDTSTELLQTCELLRAELERTWLGKSAPGSWRPRCEIVVHPSLAAYCQAVGRGAAQTSGASTIRFQGKQVSLRRIDLAPAIEGRGSALAHELTHVVLADRFAGRQPPRWADEGIATLSDSAAKQRLHDRDCRSALDGGTAFPLAELVRLERCTTHDQFAAFYGQSLSLVRFLSSQESSQRFVDFVELAMDHGYDRALQRTYGIESVAHLDRQWREHALSPMPIPVRTVSFPELRK